MVKLFVDTTFSTLQLALLGKDEQWVTMKPDMPNNSNRYQASLLIPTLQQMLADIHKTPQDLTALSVNLGPGSFTGIRVGLTVVRMIGQFLEIPCYGFNTFELMAATPQYRGKSLTLILNAFRGQHYRAALQVNADATITWLQTPGVFPNTEPLSVETEECLLELSLKETVPLQHPQPQFLQETTIFTPEAMRFYLAHQPEPFQQPWQDIQPLYLQLPHITPPKTQHSTSSLS